MPEFDVLICDATIVSPSGVEQGDIAIADGKVAARGPNLGGNAAETIRAAGLHLFPGVIDAHVHCNEPGRTEWEGFASASRALIAGGSTLFFDMPLNCSPPTIDAASFREKATLGESQSLADFALWGGLVPSNVDRLEELHACGVVGFKAFMAESGIQDFPCVDDAALYAGMEKAASLPSLVAVHAENNDMTRTRARRAVAEGRTSIQDYLDSRPVIAELEAIERAILFAAEAGCPLHIVHVSTGRGVRLVAEARSRRMDVTCETCPHYLLLTQEDVQSLGAIAKCAPPLRSRPHQDELWTCLRSGLIDMVVSDHSPGLPAMKTGSNFFSIWGGISGCQSLLSTLISEGAQKERLSLPQVSALTSENAARRFSLFPRKGSLEPGADADLTLVDLKSPATLFAEDLFYRHRYSPYVGRTFGCTIVRTLLRGTTVYLDGKIVSAPGARLVRAGMS